MTELRKRGGGGDDRGSAEDMSDKVGDKGTGKRGDEKTRKIGRAHV